MTGKTLTAWVLAFAATTLCSAANAQRFEAGPPALFQGSEHLRWGVGLHGGWDRRNFQIADETRRIDLQRLRVRLSVDALPGTDLWVEGGAAQTWLDEEGPDLATEWAAGADLHVFEHVLKDSPVVGRREWVGLNLSGSLRRTSADVDAQEAVWRERRAGIVARYGRTENPEDTLRSATLAGQIIRAGLVKTRLRGRVEHERARESDDLGILLGFDVLWTSGWVARFEVLGFGASNRELALAVSRFF